MAILRELGRVDYAVSLTAMRQFTDRRRSDTADEVWFLEHPAVFTMGLAAKTEHLLAPAEIPVVYVERGGQVTFHGPGQLVAYTLLDIKRLKINVKNLVCQLEQSLIATLNDFGVDSARKPGAPGVYVGSGAKIAALGLKIRNGCCYHGMALNIAMDLEPFSRINPCGYSGLAVTDLVSEFAPQANQPVDTLTAAVKSALAHNLGKALDISFNRTTTSFEVHDHETN